MARMIHERLLCATLVLCVAYRRLTAQPTTDQCFTDDDNSRMLVRTEHMISMLQAISERQMSLIEQMISMQQASSERQTSLMQKMYCTLLSTDRHVMENQVDIRCRQGFDGNRTCYKIVRESLKRDAAREYCRSYIDWADLVSIETAEEQAFLSPSLKELHDNTYYFHTSGRKGPDGVWKWMATGNPFTYTAWAPGEPTGNGNYCYVWTAKVPGWKTWDDSVDVAAYFICEYDIKMPSYCQM